MNRKDEYEFPVLPLTERLMSGISFFSFGAAALMMFFYLFFLFAGARFDRWSGFLLFAAIFIALISLGVAFLLLWRKRVPVETRKLLQEKILPPLEKAENVPVSLDLEIKRSSDLSTYFFLIFYIAFALAWGYVVILDPLYWKREPVIPLVGVFIVALGIPCCVYFARRTRTLSKLIKTTKMFRMSPEGIEIPIDLLDLSTQSTLMESQWPSLLLKWDQIRSWSVDPGYSDEPSVYLVKTSSPHGMIRIARPPFYGKERSVLDYVRAQGVTVILKTFIF